MGEQQPQPTLRNPNLVFIHQCNKTAKIPYNHANFRPSSPKIFFNLNSPSVPKNMVQNIFIHTSLLFKLKSTLMRASLLVRHLKTKSTNANNCIWWLIQPCIDIVITCVQLKRNIFLGQGYYQNLGPLTKVLAFSMGHPIIEVLTIF